LGKLNKIDIFPQTAGIERANPAEESTIIAQAKIAVAKVDLRKRGFFYW